MMLSVRFRDKPFPCRFGCKSVDLLLSANAILDLLCLIRSIRLRTRMDLYFIINDNGFGRLKHSHLIPRYFFLKFGLNFFCISITLSEFTKISFLGSAQVYVNILKYLVQAWYTLCFILISDAQLSTLRSNNLFTITDDLLG